MIYMIIENGIFELIIVEHKLLSLCIDSEFDFLHEVDDDSSLEFLYHR